MIQSTLLENSQFAQGVGLALVHSFWQILLIAVIFEIASRLLPRRSANLRYVVAYAALILTLALPVLTLLHTFGLFTASQESFTEFSRDASKKADNVYAVAEVALFSVEPRENWPNVAQDVSGLSRAIGSQSERGLSWILPWLSVGWSFGVIAFSIRPLLALRRCHQLRKQALPVRDSWIADTLESLCGRMGLIRKVEIATSALVHVPTAMGFLRPIVFLPLSMVSGQTPQELSAILAHELAHIRRYDYLLNLFQTVIETLLFYHPAVWWLSAVVRQERENCCDDIAMSMCGRKNYAMALANLEFARTRSASLVIAADGGSLYRRIHRIVRPQENPNPLGRWLAAVVALVALLLAIVVILPTDAVAVAADDQSKAQDVVATETPLSERFPNDLIELDGQVLTPEGQPIGGAKVYALRWHWNDPTHQRPLAMTASQSDGSFKISYRKSQFDADIGKPEQWKQTWFVATAKGYGLGLLSLEDVRPKKSNTLQLVEDQQVSGRVIDLEGRPVANAVVRPVRMDLAVVGSIDGFVKSVRDGAVVPQSFREHLGAMRQLTCVPEFANINTDADGKFQLNGLGKDRVVYIICSGRHVATTEFVVATQRMQPFSVATEGLSPNATGMLFGSEVQLTAAPTQIIHGTVIDAQTHVPIAGVIVRGGRGRTQCQTQTDKSGTYRLAGLPRLDAQSIAFVAPPNQPYFNRTEEVSLVEGLQESQLDIELHHGEWISGKVTDEMGQGVFARVHYVPYRDNPHAVRIRQFRQGLDNKYFRETSFDGSFRILGVPGHAILGVSEMDPDEFQCGVGAKELSGYDPDDDLSPSPSLYGVLGAKSLTAVKELGPESTHEGKQYELSLRRLPSEAKVAGNVITKLEKDLQQQPANKQGEVTTGNGEPKHVKPPSDSPTEKSKSDDIDNDEHTNAVHPTAKRPTYFHAASDGLQETTEVFQQRPQLATSESGSKMSVVMMNGQPYRLEIPRYTTPCYTLTVDGQHNEDGESAAGRDWYSWSERTVEQGVSTTFSSGPNSSYKFFAWPVNGNKVQLTCVWEQKRREPRTVASQQLWTSKFTAFSQEVQLGREQTIELVSPQDSKAREALRVQVEGPMNLLMMRWRPVARK